jgi:predicted RNase H-like HicB family nuclease
VLEEDTGDEGGGGGFAAASPEMPNVLGHGATAGEAAADLRLKLAEEAYGVLDRGAYPPEALQDVEARVPRPRVAKVA